MYSYFDLPRGLKLLPHFFAKSSDFDPVDRLVAPVHFRVLLLRVMKQLSLELSFLASLDLFVEGCGLSRVLAGHMATQSLPMFKDVTALLAHKGHRVI